MWRRQASPIRSYDNIPSRATPKPPESLDTFNRFRAQIQECYQQPQSQDEFDNYLVEVLYGLEIEDLVKQWLDKEQTKQWLQLSVFAINILLIPLISIKLEVIFLGGRRTVRWDQVQLGAELLEVTECEKDQIQSDILKSEP